MTNDKMEFKLLIMLLLLQIFLVHCSRKVENPGSYCKFSPNHTMCHYKLQGSSCGDNFKSEKVTEEQKKLILHLHNELRSNLAEGKEKLGKPGPQPPASNMMEMEWDTELATIAQTHANQCVFRHQCQNCSKVDRFNVGQNIYKTFSSFYDDNTDWSITIRKWYSEVQEFSNALVMPFVYSFEAGHFSQIVWWNTRRIGCGASRFQRHGWWMTLYVCNYGPMGNRILSSLYNIGENCSACPNNTSCSDVYKGLCKIEKNLTTTETFWTDNEFFAVADRKYIDDMFPELQKQYEAISDNYLHFSKDSNSKLKIPGHVKKYLHLFANESIPQNFRMVSSIDPTNSVKEKRPPARISSVTGDLDYLLATEKSKSDKPK